MATFASADLTLLTVVERCGFYRQRYAELSTLCRELLAPWHPGRPSLAQTLERIREHVAAEDAYRQARAGSSSGGAEGGEAG